MPTLGHLLWLNIIHTLLLGFAITIVTTGASETGGSLSKKDKGSDTSSLLQLQPRADAALASNIMLLLHYRDQ